MNAGDIVLHDGELSRLKSILTRTQRAITADLVLLVERSGQMICCDGQARQIDLTALASLAAANMAATDGLARLVGEGEFSVLSHQGKHRNILISTVTSRFCLVVVYAGGTAPNVVRLRVKHAAAYLEEVFRHLARRARDGQDTAPGAAAESPLDFTDEEIDRLLEN
jgi:predicted regulator of Ras-like GTPase activity (Roadblock/LC7/MglB family)